MNDQRSLKDQLTDLAAMADCAGLYDAADYVRCVLDHRHASTEGQPDVMPKVDGKAFRCDCGCNVFKNPKGEPHVYVCNACGDRYRGEP